VDDRLRPLWDFGDLDASERRLREQLAAEPDDDGRAEVLTQLARVEGLRERFDAADAILDEAEPLASSEIASARLVLERGRVRRSSGEPAAARPLFESAYAAALAGGQDFVAADAAHMAALAAPDRQGLLAWTTRGLELAESSEGAAYWAGPLLNNLGWAYDEAGEREAARDAFERALRAREAADDPEQTAIARYALGRSLRLLGRPAEAAAQLEQAVAWTESTGVPDGWFHEELAEDYAALSRDGDARAHARLAIPLLEAADPSFAGDEARTARLRELAGVA
jgi:tetratricopeptide (TPR) repeat protein